MQPIEQAAQRQKRPILMNVPEGAVRILESHHAVDFTMELSDWPFHKLCWVAEGQGTLESRGGSTAIEREDFLLLPAGWSHRFIDLPTEPLTLVIFCISGKLVNGPENHERNSLWQQVLEQIPAGQPYCAKTTFLRSSLVAQFRTALTEQERARPGWETALTAIVDQLLVSLVRGACELREAHLPSSQQTVAGAIEYLDTHFYEPVQIAEMAEQCGLSRRRFTDLFREQTGETFNQYLNRKRIEHACERIERTGHILYACHQSGFNDVAYFYRVFRKFAGLTPGAYLRKTREER